MPNNAKPELDGERDLVEAIATLAKTLSPTDPAAESEAEKIVALMLARFGEEIGRYRGKVAAIGTSDGLPEDTAQIEFDGGRKTFLRVFPKERLATIKALFLGAEIEYILYRLGTVSASTMLYVGPSAAELLQKEPTFIPEADLRVLEEHS